MIKLDLHVHSQYSPDGSTSCEQILKRAAEHGLDGLAITDHDFFDPKLYTSLQQQTDLLLIPAEEVSSESGHILAYFIEEEIEPWREPEEIVNDIHDQNGLAVIAHPYRLRFSYPKGYFDLFDGIEAFNGRSGDPESSNTPNFHTQNFVEAGNYSLTGGSDSHLYWTIGNAYTVLNCEKNLKAVKTAIVDGKTKPEGIPSLQSNRALSQFVRLLKDPEYNRWFKTFAKSLRWMGVDLIHGLKKLRRKIT